MIKAMKIAKHIPGTLRQFKQRKRKEFKAIIQAFEQYRLGAAYAPYDTYILQRCLAEGLKSLSVKEWGR